MEKKLRSEHRGKPSDSFDIKRLIIALEGVSERLDKSIEIQEKLLLLEKKKLLNENRKLNGEGN